MHHRWSKNTVNLLASRFQDRCRHLRLKVIMSLQFLYPPAPFNPQRMRFWAPGFPFMEASQSQSIQFQNNNYADMAIHHAYRALRALWASEAFLSLFLAFHCLYRHFPSRKRLFVCANYLFSNLNLAVNVLRMIQKVYLSQSKNKFHNKCNWITSVSNFTTMTQVVTKNLQYVDTASTTSVLLLNTQGTRKRMGVGGGGYTSGALYSSA